MHKGKHDFKDNVIFTMTTNKLKNNNSKNMNDNISNQ